MFKQSTSQNLDPQNIQIQIPDLNRLKSNPPIALQQTIRKKNLEAIDPEAKQLGSMVLSWSLKLKKMSRPNYCYICETDAFVTTGLFISNCEHKESFCFSCLQHYATYIIDNQFTKVLCPGDSCGIQMDINGSFFKTLPGKVQTKYHKILRFYDSIKEKQARACPRESCNGLLRLVNEGSNQMKCQQCDSQFCIKCYLPFHQGQCDQHQLEYFEKNLHYRQCPKCKMLIDKFEGCNHMTCRCGNQFCYVCGAIWTPAHYQNHDQNGIFIEPPTNAQQEWRPAVELQDRVQGRQSQRGIGYWISFPLRIIVAIVLYTLIIALFAGVVVVTILAAFGAAQTKKSNQNHQASQGRMNQCVDNMCAAYFKLYGKVYQLLF